MHRWILPILLTLAPGAHAAAPPTGPATVLVVPVYYSNGLPANFPPADLAARYEAANAAIKNFSYGTAELDVTIGPPTQLGNNIAFYRPRPRSRIADDTDALLAGTANDPVNFDIVSYFTPLTQLDGFAGFAQPDSGRQWINGVTRQAPVIAHECIHNYGMGHAGSWVTNTGTIFGNNGSFDEYGDPADIMGGNAGFQFPNNHPNPVIARKPGWVAPGKIVDATGGGNFELYRFDHIGASSAPGPLALRFTPPGGEAYTLAYRAVSAPDGAILLWEYQGFRSRLLDCTPGSAAGIVDGWLAFDKPFTDPTGQVRVTVLGKGGSAPHEFLKVSVETRPESSPGTGISLPPEVPAFARTPFVVTGGTGWTWHSDVVGISAASALTGETVIVGERGLATGGNEMAIGRADTRSHPFSRFEPYATNTGTVAHTLHSNGAQLIAGFDGGVSYTSRPFGWATRAVPIDVLSITGNGVAGIPYVAVGETPAGSGGIFYSTDAGATWTAVVVPPGLPILRGVAYGDGRFVAIGDTGTGVTSTDGINWGGMGTGTTGALYAIDHADGTWVIAGDENRILTSPGATTWTERFVARGAPISVRALAYSDGIWFASGLGNGVGISADGGTTWTPSYLPNQTTGVIQLDALAAGGGAVFSAGNGLATSASTGTGRAWAPIPAWETTTTATAATFHGGRLFVATAGGDILASGPLHGSGVPYNRWALTHLPASAGRNADPDADGLTNFQEYARATHPGIASHTADPGLWSPPTGTRFLYHFPRPHLDTILQSSPDLTTWSPETPTPIGDALGFPFAPASGRSFYRWEDSEP